MNLENARLTLSGLEYVDDVPGAGPRPRMDQRVTVHYTGSLAAGGHVFDSSVERGAPPTFAMGGLIPGFAEGLATMRVGGKRRLFIPAALAYGAAGAGPIPPHADLIFEVELIAIE